MKRIFLMFTAILTFSTAMVSCRDTENNADDVEMEATDDQINDEDRIQVDGDVEINDDLNGTTRGGNMAPENTGTTTGTITTNGATDNDGSNTTDELDRTNNP